MTNDRFDYWTDKDFEYTGVLNFYTPSLFENKKGKEFILRIETNKPMTEDVIDLIAGFAKNWTWGEDRYIKAFKLLDETFNDMLISYILQTIRKSRSHDEIKYFLFDVGGLLYYKDNKISGITIIEKN